MKKQKVKKFLLFLVVFMEVFFVSVQPTLALSIPSVDEVLRKIESTYHIDRGSVQNQGEYFNVSDSKKEAPQVMLSFNPSDPKPGEKITAEALPMYFSNATESLYFTWYLRKVYFIGGKKITCDKGSDDKDVIKYCDRDDNGEVDENDWKIEAMRNITNGGFDATKADYTTDGDLDRDSYEAIWGGDNKYKELKYFNEDYYLTDSSGNYIYEPDNNNNVHCYLHDFQGGLNYELAGSNSYQFNCPLPNQQAICVEDTTLSCAGAGSFTDYAICNESSDNPTCSNVSSGTGHAACSSGQPVCTTSVPSFNCSTVTGVTDHSCQTQFPTYYNAGATISCTASRSNGSRNMCRHLFAMYDDFKGQINMGEDENGNQVLINADLENEKLGDGHYRIGGSGDGGEEAFWKTNPSDEDTADNGKKDEANAVGLGINTLTWNYAAGDKVGVAIEGASMIPTKHDDSTMMIMWALPKNKCDITDTSRHYTKNIKKYDVEIPTTTTDLNDCLEDNLVDPKEEGHPSRINVSLSYAPENPVNDTTPLAEGNTGDVINTSATTDNSDEDVNQSEYEWGVYLSSNGSPDPAVTTTGRWVNITDALINNDLIDGPIKGNGLVGLDVKLGINKDMLPSGVNFAEAFPSGIGYLNIRAAVREYFDSEVAREGKGEAIIKIMSSSEKLTAYAARVDTGTGKVLISGSSDKICENCNQKKAPICYAVKNNIIGLKFESADFDPTDDNYLWTINGETLNCNSQVSDSCLDEKQTNINFFPVTGDPGTTYTVSLTATKGLSADSDKSGKTISLTRVFQVIDPFVKIEPGSDSVWKKHLGVYIDLDDNAFEDLSSSIFETFSGTAPNLIAQFHPSWLINYIEPDELEFSFDGKKVDVTQTTVSTETDADCPNVSIPVYSATAPSTDDKGPGSVYNADVRAVFNFPNENKKALKDIWGISQFDMGESLMSDSVQVEVSTTDSTNVSMLKKPVKFLASLITYIPGEFTFLLRIVLTIFVIILTTGIIFSLTPENLRIKSIKD